jgi:hypothetical protein
MKRVPFADFLRNLLSSDYRLTCGHREHQQQETSAGLYSLCKKKRRPLRLMPGSETKL